MEKRAFIFIGQSGCGKGTQVKLLEQKIKELNAQSRIFHLETGEQFRKLIKGNSFTELKVKEYIEHGKLPPAFLGIHMWAHVLISDYQGEEFVFLDGTPRVMIEVDSLFSAFEFYEWKPSFIFITVSDEWAKEKLLARGRSDDESLEIGGRLNWFHRDVSPVIELLRKSDKVSFVEVNGEQPVGQVHQDILKKLNI